MKKILLFFFMTVMVPCYANAEKLYAVVQEEISKNTVKNTSCVKLYAWENSKLSDSIFIEEGEEITVSLDEYVAPKRGKLNGYYKVTYKGPFPDEMPENELNLKGTMKVSTPKDFKEMAKNAGVSVAGHFLKVPGFTQAVAVAKGLIAPNENSGRLKSAGENLYESTPLTYVEKGTDFLAEPDSIVVIKLKEIDSVDE